MSEWKNRIIESREMAINEIVPNPRNWRTHPQIQEDALAGSMDEIGYLKRITFNQRTGHLIDGHLRLKLALKRNEKTVPVDIVDLSQSEEDKALLLLDPITGMAEANKDLLAELMREVVTDSPGIKKLIGDLATKNKIMLGGSQEDNYQPPAAIETEIQRGEIFQLGKHRIMCGDSTSSEDVTMLLAEGGGVRHHGY